MSSSSVPLPMKLDCCPLSLPAMLTRSTITPGTVRSTAQGSRELGTWCSSSVLSVVPVPVFLVSMTGVSAVTVTVSSTVGHLQAEDEIDVGAGLDHARRGSRW